MSNPNQEPTPEQLTQPQALPLIAERTPFRTEEENNAVLAAIDKAIADDDKADQGDPEPDPDPDGHTPDGGNAPAAPDSDTPQPTTPRKATARSR